MTAEPIGPVDYILWDFGNTLVDEDFMRSNPPGVSGWEVVWDSSDEALQDWCRGDTSESEFAGLLADQLPMNREDVLKHMNARYRAIIFFDSALDFAKRLKTRQALVTVNPDIFRSVITPHYGLDAPFEFIVTSAEERTNDKVALCDIAMKKAAPSPEKAKTLLIDNTKPNVDGWIADGGLGYWFQGQEKFELDLNGILASLT